MISFICCTLVMPFIIGMSWMAVPRASVVYSSRMLVMMTLITASYPDL